MYNARFIAIFIVCSADQSKQRREVVRRKTAEYLKHAEELYQKHLAPSSNDGEKEKVHIHIHTCTYTIHVHNTVTIHFRISLSASGSASLFFPPSFLPLSLSLHHHIVPIFFFVSSSTAHTLVPYLHIILRPIHYVQVNQLEQLPPPPSSKPHLLPDFKVVGIIGKVSHTHKQIQCTVHVNTHVHVRV